MSFFFYDRNYFRSSNYRQRFGRSTNDNLYGSAFRDDFLEGNRGNDNLYGFAGRDILVGVDPDKAFPGMNERDYLTGGSGTDYFVLGDKNNPYYYNYSWENFNGYATITDYDDRYDYVVIEGVSSQYELKDAYNFGSRSWETQLYRDDDIIAIFEGGRQSDLGLSLGSNDFIELR